jgi:GT2 family glycosyltransferase
MPSRWWTGRAAVTSHRPSTRLSLPFAGHRGHFLVGAALLLRRETIERVGAFDTTFFLFNEDLDLCRRIEADRWRLAVCPEATFVHVGGVATRPRWDYVYREQLRGHLRLLRKHEGPAAAESARRWLSVTLRVRAAGGGERACALRETARWLRTHSVDELLAGRPERPDP